MRFFTIALAIVLVAVCSVIIDASPATDKRFIGSIGSWINDNIIKPVEQTVVNPVIGAINNNVIKPIQQIISGPNVPQPPQQNLCADNCLSRFNSDGAILDFFLNQPNGCRAKGFVKNQAALFDSCCDQHSACLNNQCCTTDCGDKKNACDVAFRKCARETCDPLFADYNKYDACQKLNDDVVKQVLAYKCKVESTINRKVCYCHV